jgi:putative copper resistance protein D
MQQAAGTILVVVSRGLFLASILSGFGTALFAVALLKPVMQDLDAKARRLVEGRVRSVMQLSLAAALLFGLAWLVLEAEGMSGASTLAETLAAMPEVLLQTSFGRVLILQGLTITAALAAAVIRWPSRLTVGFAGLAVLLESGHSHGFAMGDNGLLLSEGLHLLASGAWLGALLPLLIVVRDAPLAAAESAASRFATLGTIAVTVLAGSALYQGFVLSGGLKGLTGTAYGAVLITKAALFALLLALAAVNRWRLTPALAGQDGEAARETLALSVAAETVIGLLVVIAASELSTLEPGMHTVGE